MSSKTAKLVYAGLLCLYIYGRYGDQLQKLFTHQPAPRVGLQGVDGTYLQGFNAPTPLNQPPVNPFLNPAELGLSSKPTGTN